MNKHTPGPWNCLKASSAGYDIVSSDNRPVDICVMSKRDKSPDEINANARLIAAAPALLEALERTLPWLNNYPAEAAMGPDGPYEQARAAIAAAKGAK